MKIRTNVEELIDAVNAAAGCIEPHRLSATALSALPLVGHLKRIECEVCRLVLVANYRRKLCPDCSNVRENRAQWQRERARRRR